MKSTTAKGKESESKQDYRDRMKVLKEDERATVLEFAKIYPLIPKRMILKKAEKRGFLKKYMAIDLKHLWEIKESSMKGVKVSHSSDEATVEEDSEESYDNDYDNFKSKKTVKRFDDSRREDRWGNEQPNSKKDRRDDDDYYKRNNKYTKNANKGANQAYFSKNDKKGKFEKGWN